MFQTEIIVSDKTYWYSTDVFHTILYRSLNMINTSAECLFVCKYIRVIDLVYGVDLNFIRCC